MQYDPMSPIWLQVAGRIKQEIVTGQRPPGSRLPGGRDLALDFSINPNTAARVYRELEGEGVCITKRGLGTFVTEDGERIGALREEMASEATERFLKSMFALGFSAGDAIELIKREEEHAHAGEQGSNEEV